MREVIMHCLPVVMKVAYMQKAVSSPLMIQHAAMGPIMKEAKYPY